MDRGFAIGFSPGQATMYSPEDQRPLRVMMKLQKSYLIHHGPSGL